MVKSEIISKLSEKVHRKIKKSELETIVNLTLKPLLMKYGSKGNGDKTVWSFLPKKIKENECQRSSNRKTVHSKEKLSIAFKMSKELKYAINKMKEI